VGGNYLDNVVGYGLLFGKTIPLGELGYAESGPMSAYSFWDSKIFEVGTLGFRGGLISRWTWSKDVPIFRRLSSRGRSSGRQQFAISILSRKVSISGIMIIPAEAKPSSKSPSPGRPGAIHRDLLFLSVVYVSGTARRQKHPDLQPRFSPPGSRQLSPWGSNMPGTTRTLILEIFPDVDISNSEQKVYLMLYF